MQHNVFLSKLITTSLVQKLAKIWATSEFFKKPPEKNKHTNLPHRRFFVHFFRGKFRGKFSPPKMTGKIKIFVEKKF
jgi:hypothetical protein